MIGHREVLLSPVRVVSPSAGMLTSRHRAEGGDGIAVSGGSGDGGWISLSFPICGRRRR